MKQDEKKKISEFLKGNLKDGELDKFYKEIEEDNELLEDLAVSVVKEYGRMKFKDKLESIHDDMYGRPKIHLNLNFKVAASIAIILGSAFLLYFLLLKNPEIPEEFVHVDTTVTDKEVEIAEDGTVNKVEGEIIPLPDKDNELIAEGPKGLARNNTEIFTAYFAPHQVDKYRGSEDQLDRAFELYEQQSFQEASELFGKALKYLDNNKQINEALFYQGVSILAVDSTQNQLENARQLLHAVYVDEGSILKEQAGWYLALLYIKSGEKDKAREILTRIIKEKKYNYKQADLLLKEL